MTPTIETMAAALIAEGAPADSATLAAGLALDRLRYPDHGGTPIVLDKDGVPAIGADGAPVPVASLMASLRIELPQLFGSKPSTTTAHPPAGETVTAKAAREHREAMARRERQSAGEPVNPWKSGSINVTQQVLITARDPVRAAKLKADAGV